MGEAGRYVYTCTLPETNIAPENRPLEKDIPTGFRGYVSFQGCKMYWYSLIKSLFVGSV